MGFADPPVRFSQLKATEDRLKTEINQMGNSIKKDLKIDFEANLSASVIRMGMQFDVKYEVENLKQLLLVKLLIVGINLIK